jgi:Ca2+-binding EF-hand superfamily protein
MRTDKHPATSRKDFDGYWEKLFTMADLDQNGSLSPEEMLADALLKTLDKDQSNSIELEEWLAAYDGMFDKFDRDQDGSLSPEEKNQLAR